jgi:TPR repeat protein
MSQLIHNFNNINTEELETSKSSYNNFGTMFDEIISFLEDTETNEIKYKVVKYLNSQNIISQEIYNWLSNNQNISNSFFLLGVFYHFGIGINVDKQKAFDLYQKAANSENIFGILSLGYCYNNGIGTRVNKQKAFELYQKAANLGNYLAQYHLALMYENGKGVKRDIIQAINWYKKSADQGYQVALNALEICCNLIN